MDDLRFVILHRRDSHLSVVRRPLVAPSSPQAPYNHQLVIDAQEAVGGLHLTDAGFDVGVDVVQNWWSHG